MVDMKSRVRDALSSSSHRRSGGGSSSGGLGSSSHHRRSGGGRSYISKKQAAAREKESDDRKNLVKSSFLASMGESIHIGGDDDNCFLKEDDIFNKSMSGSGGVGGSNHSKSSKSKPRPRSNSKSRTPRKAKSMPVRKKKKGERIPGSSMDDSINISALPVDSAHTASTGSTSSFLMASENFNNSFADLANYSNHLNNSRHGRSKSRGCDANGVSPKPSGGGVARKMKKGLAKAVGVKGVKKGTKEVLNAAKEIHKGSQDGDQGYQLHDDSSDDDDDLSEFDEFGGDDNDNEGAGGIFSSIINTGLSILESAYDESRT